MGVKLVETFLYSIKFQAFNRLSIREAISLQIYVHMYMYMYTHTHSLQAITDSFNSNASRLHVHFTNAEVYIAVAIYAIGGMTGALTGGFIADHIGRYIQTRRT